ncbi:uncharacterized protein LOC144448590 isoform X2 [Glandiceps talaboti]
MLFAVVLTLLVTSLSNFIHAVPVEDQTTVKALTKVGVEAIRNDLREGLRKLEDVHNLMSDDERVRIIAMHSANQTHQLALHNLLTEWKALQNTNVTCIQSLKEVYIERCIPCIIETCEVRYNSYCRLVPVRAEQLASVDTRDFDISIRDSIGHNADGVFEEKVRQWFANRDENFDDILEDLDWLWKKIRVIADDVENFGTDDARSWFTEITDDFILFFVNRLENWVKSERDDIANSVTDTVDGWFDELNPGRNDSRHTVGDVVDAALDRVDDIWDDLRDLADETQDRIDDRLDELADNINEFYEDQVGEHVDLARNRTQEAISNIKDNVRPFVGVVANRTQNVLEDIEDAIDDVTGDVGEWFDETFGGLFDDVANKTKTSLESVFDTIGGIFGGPFHDRRRRSVSRLDHWDVNPEAEQQNGEPTCEELNDEDTRGQACMKFASKCPKCDLILEKDCPGFRHVKEDLVNALFDFRNATSLYRRVFETFKEGQREYYSGLQRLAKRYRWISRFQELPEDERGYKVLGINFDPSVRDDNLDDEFAPVEATVVMFGKDPHSFVVDVPTQPWNDDIAGTMIAARSLAWYASQ